MCYTRLADYYLGRKEGEEHREFSFFCLCFFVEVTESYEPSLTYTIPEGVFVLVDGALSTGLGNCGK